MILRAGAAGVCEPAHRRDAGLPQFGRIEPWRPVPRILIGLLLAAGVAGHSRADPHAVIPNGLPVQVVPTYPEPGLPSFKYPEGAPDTGGVPGATDIGAGTGGDGSGYAGTGDGVAGATVAHDYSGFIGQSVGSRECVALVQATSDVGLTATWSPGSQVQGNMDLAPGTVIATFGADGTYTNTYGQSHAAIYLGQDATGIIVEDQWKNQPAQQRHINWTTTNSYEGGSKFYVVSHG